MAKKRVFYNTPDSSVISEGKKTIGNLIKSQRKKNNLSTYKVARRAGIAIHQVQSIESGNKEYTIDSLLKILYALDLSLFMKPKDTIHPK